MRHKLLFGSLTTSALVLVVGVIAEAQLPKRGAFSGIVGYRFPMSQVVQVDNDQWIWGGMYQGAFRNDTGEGFLHRTSVVCTALGSSRRAR